MPPVTADALVLDVRPYRETSLLVTLLTRDHGRVGALAKGAHRRGSPLAAILQPYSLVRAQLTLRATSGLAGLHGADLLARPSYAAPSVAVPRTLERVAYAGLIAEILTHSLEQDSHSRELFDHARAVFARLGTTDSPGSFAVCALFSLLGEFGYALEPMSSGNADDAQSAIQENVPACSDRRPDGIWHVDLSRGVILPGPRPAMDRARGAPPHCHALNAREVAALTRILASPYTPSDDAAADADRAAADADRGADPILPRAVGAHLLRLAVAMFEYHLEFRLRSVRFLEEMVLNPPTLGNASHKS